MPGNLNFRSMKTIFRKLLSGWKKFALGFARVQAEIILFVFYFLIFTPYGWILCLFGHDPLHFRLKEKSNWESCRLGEFDPERATRQS